MLPFPPSRWEEDSEEDDDDDDDDNSLDSKKNLPLGTDLNKRSENAIFRRAISAIKPKHIEIKLRPERRVFVDSANVEKEADAEEMKKVADVATVKKWYDLVTWCQTDQSWKTRIS